MSGPWEQYKTASPATPAPPSTQEAGPWAAYADPAAADQKAPPPAAAPMELTVTNLKGRKIKFTAPADADDATIRRLAARATGEPRYAKAIVQRAAAEEGQPAAPEEVKPEADDHSALSGFAAGALKPIDNIAEWVSNTGVGKAIDDFGVSLGFPSVAESNAEHDEWRRNNTRTGYQMLGNIAGTLPASRLPGGLAVQGGASGALLSDADTAEGVGLDALLGAGGSVVGGKIVQGLGSLATGVTDKGLRALNAAGVPLTLGQIASAGKGFVSRAVAKTEEGLTSVPLLGDLINSARDRGTQGLNIALGNRILANVGDRLRPGVEAGHDMVDAVQSRLSSRYARLVPQLRGVMDAQFVADLNAAKAATATLPDARRRQLAQIVDDVFRNRTNGATISGQALKDAESRLTNLYGKYKRSTDADQTILADAIDTVRQGLRGMVQRSNPAHAEELQGLNTAWAQLKALRTASQAAGNNATGVVTPASALRAYTAGGYRDRFLETAKQVLPNTTPDSGTARRGMIGLGTLAAGGGVGATTVSPALAAPAMGSLLYTEAGQKALNAAAFANRPAAVRGTGTALKALSRYAPQLVAPALVPAQQ